MRDGVLNAIRAEQDCKVFVITSDKSGSKEAKKISRK